jgi:hypothetical protein
MDVYQRVLLKVYDISGGRDTVDVDFADILKKEGFYPSLKSILEQLVSQSWITETSRKNIVRLTHWGTQEAKKLQSASPEAAKYAQIKKESTRLLSEVREFARILEEFSSEQTKANFSNIESKISEINTAIANIKTNIQ